MSGTQEVKKLVGGLVPGVGKIYFCPEYETLCCRIRKDDHKANNLGFENADLEIHGMPDSIFIFLDQGRMEWASDLEFGRSDIWVEGPLSQDEISMQLMLSPHIDFTPWTKLYGKE